MSAAQGQDDEDKGWKSVRGLSDAFILRPVGTTLMAIGLFLVGMVAYIFLPVASLPSVDFPTIRVFASRPGADPATMAGSVAAPRPPDRTPDSRERGSPILHSFRIVRGARNISKGKERKSPAYFTQQAGPFLRGLASCRRSIAGSSA